MGVFMRKLMMLICSLFFLSACDNNDQASSDDVKIFTNGTIYTGTDANPTVEAVVVKDNRIVFTGSEADARSQFGAGAELVDLGGAYMYPGFTDSHFHLPFVGRRELILNLDGVPSLAEMVERVAAEVDKTPPGDLVEGMAWMETHWPEGRFPNRHDLDAISPDNPVMLTRADGHSSVVNTKMLEMAGITKDTVPPAGGELRKDPDGELTGLVVDLAHQLLIPVLENFTPSPERIEEFHLVGGEFYNSHGWTAGHNMSVDPAVVPLMERLADEGRLTLRVYNSLEGTTPGATDIFQNGPSTSQNGLIVTRAIKMYMDGSLGSKSALFFEPYVDGDYTGLTLTQKEDMMALFIPALEKGIQMNVHAIGDRGNHLLLNWVEEAYQAVPEERRAIADPRWRDEHTQHVKPADIPRYKELGVIPSMQPSHAIGDLFFAPSRIGMERLADSYTWKPFLDDGWIIAGGTDAPVELGDPRIEFYAAVARKDKQGNTHEGWHPELAVTRDQALKMFTIWPAYASFREDDLGTIEVGKLADFTVFSDDIMTIPELEILNVEVVMTVVDGEIVYLRE